MRAILMVAAAVGLAGCAEKQLNELTYPEMVKVAARLQAECVKQAGPIGSPAYKICAQQSILAEDARRRKSVEDAQAARQIIGGGLAGFGQGYNAGLAATPAYVPPVRCTSNVSGAYTTNPTMNTTCY